MYSVSLCGQASNAFDTTDHLIPFVIVSLKYHILSAVFFLFFFFIFSQLFSVFLDCSLVLNRGSV